MIKKGIVCILGIILLSFSIISAESIGIETKQSFTPGDKVEFKLALYDDNGKQLDGEIDYFVKDYLLNDIMSGKVKSGERVYFPLETNAERGLWEINTKYKDFEKKEYFNVLELEKADIKIEGDNLIIKNIGNVIYRKSLQIQIGEYKETAIVPLEIGETKKIKLTAPNGSYDIKVNDGTTKEDIVFSGVSLTGNVIGLEKTSGKGFLKQYPIVSLFLISLLLVIAAVSVLKIYNRYKGLKVQDQKM
ncbi:MAG: hypothetical protein Q8N99_08590 [Nanoarchaeota archaeon]|nr:hypothetical protein [Nanoarchaeota archaeon]